MPAFLAPRPLQPAADGLHIALVGTRAGLLAGDGLALHITVRAGASAPRRTGRVVGSVTALGADPGGPPHPYRMDLAGPGAQIRLLDTVAPAVEAELAAVWESWREALPA